MRELGIKKGKARQFYKLRDAFIHKIWKAAYGGVWTGCKHDFGEEKRPSPNWSSTTYDLGGLEQVT